MADVNANLGLEQSEADEGVLLNTLKHDLEAAVRAYLHRTQRAYPITLVFDISGP